MPSCDYISELLSLYYDGQLDADPAREVAEHLATCHACAEELEEIKTVSQAIKSIAVLTPTEAFRNSLRLRLMQAAREKTNSSKTDNWYYRIPNWLRDWRTYSTAAACLLTLFVLGTGIYKNYSPSQSPIPAAGGVPTPGVSPIAEDQATYNNPVLDTFDFEAPSQPKTAPPAVSLAGQRTTESADLALAPASQAPKKTDDASSLSAEPSSVPTTPAQQVIPHEPLFGTDPPETVYEPTVSPTDAPITNIANMPDATPEHAPAPTPESAPEHDPAMHSPRPSAPPSPDVGSAPIVRTASLKTTVYFTADSPEALRLAAEISEKYGTVSYRGNTVLVKVPNENFDELIDALQSQDGISLTKQDTETVYLSEADAKENQEYKYVQISL